MMPACMNGQQTSSEDPSKPRVIITCDPELDDLNSLIRFLLFSTDFRVEGLIYASSQFHWKGDGHGTKWYVPGREYSRNGIDYGLWKVGVGIRKNVSLTMLWKLMRRYIPI